VLQKNANYGENSIKNVKQLKSVKQERVAKRGRWSERGRGRGADGAYEKRQCKRTHYMQLEKENSGSGGGAGQREISGTHSLKYTGKKYILRNL